MARALSKPNGNEIGGRLPAALRRSLLWAIVLAVVGGCTTQLLAAEPLSGEEAVEAGRDALNRFWDYPWYDANQDAARPLNVQPPPPPRTPNFSWDMSWLYEVLVYLGWTVLALAIAVLIFFLIRLEAARTKASIKSEPAAGPVAPGQPDRVEALPFALPARHGDFYAAAEEAFRAGDYSRAMIYLYSFMLLELDRGQLIHLARGKTNRQYLRETRRRDAVLAPLLERAMVGFEEAFFGHHAISRQQFEACWNAIPQFRTHIQHALQTQERTSA